MNKTVLALLLSTRLPGCNESANDSQPPAPGVKAYDYLIELSSGT
ncbi:hypothetical protein WL1483_1151 [Aeromonas schubertii]|uniref:Uncharacterized protein n=1 Tax=Aeromonas schubertii TaxID=652 RepID=A0A0S2SG46_9GAMM|nr:hypothetical protein [Aeromonas schubertii]ALP40570.1 hypothetical protein WL1483_1151 [Aeromonas schubertii]